MLASRHIQSRHLRTRKTLVHYITIYSTEMSQPSKTTLAYTQPQIEWDEERDEPFCRVVVRGNEYRMTMWRESDADQMVRICC
jgi:hypothetical protein